MQLDVVLPIILFMISVFSLFLYSKFEHRIKVLLMHQSLSMKELVIMIVMMGVMVTIVAFMPHMAVIVLFMVSYSIILFMFMYIVTQKWYLAVSFPAVFVLLYFFYWNTHFANVFGVIFAVSVSIYLGGVLPWKYIGAFVSLLTLLDVIQVWGTNFMVKAAEKMINLNLPALISVWAFPSELKIALGVGDGFLAGLLAIQSTQKYGKKFGLASVIITITIFSLFWTIQLNSQIRYFPATLSITGGWLLALGIKYILQINVKTL